VAVCNRRVRIAPLSSLTGLVFILGPGSPAMNRWAILCRPAGFDCAPVLLRQPIRPTGAIDTSPPFQRWVPIANPISKPRRGDRRPGRALGSGGIGTRHRMSAAPTALAHWKRHFVFGPQTGIMGYSGSAVVCSDLTELVRVMWRLNLMQRPCADVIVHSRVSEKEHFA